MLRFFAPFRAVRCARVTPPAALLLFSTSICAAAAAQTSPVTGIVTSADGAAVAAATVTLEGLGADISATTDASGSFRLPSVPPGTYLLRATAARFNTLSGRTIDVRSGSVTSLRLSLVRSSSSLATIGRVQVAGNEALSTSSTPVSYVDPQQYAEAGYTRLSDVLQNNISTTLVHPAGGGSSVLPTSVALRGPDPTETLDDIDGHQVNNGNTGDFDLSLLDPADYVSVELVKGISPSSLVGPDTIDGAINIRTLEPTTDPHGLARFTIGSFDSFGETLDSTGSVGRLGYALSLHRTTTQGEVNQQIDDVSGGTPVLANVGSSMDGSTALAKLRYAFGRGDGYAEFSFHDQSATRDLSAALTSFAGADGDDGDDGDALRRRYDGDAAASSAPMVDGFEGTSLQTHNAGYGLDLSVPIGGRDAGGVSTTTALFRHYTSIVNESVFGPGADTSPYLYNNRDLVGDDSLSLDHHFYNSDLTLQYEIRNETLATDFLPGVVNDESIARLPQTLVPLARTRFDDGGGDAGTGTSLLGLGQTQRSAVLRYAYDPSSRVHLTAAAYYSDYSIFGTSFDPRFGAVYTPDARTAVRFSAGTTYQAPQLPELYVPPTLPAAVGGVISIGNPNLQPDRATEYGLGFDHVFETGPHRTTLTADVYRVNLRNPASTLVPTPSTTCDATSTDPNNLCPLSYSINAGDGVYQGYELQGSRVFAPWATATLGYAVRSAYLTAIPNDIQDGTLVIGEQAVGLPLQKATFSIAEEPPLGFRYGGGFVYEGLSNELNQPQFATFDAHLGYRWKAYEVSVNGTNLTNVYDQRFTMQGLGVPAGQDSYALQGTAISASLTRRF